MSTKDTPRAASAGEIATRSGAMDLGQTVVLGVFGPKDNMSALLRGSTGRIRQVSRGDRVKSRTVVAIDDKGILLERDGKTTRLTLAVE